VSEKLVTQQGYSAMCLFYTEADNGDKPHVLPKRRFFLGIGYLAVLSTHFTLILSSLTTVIQTHLKLIVEVL